MLQRARVRVPATTANLGAGFDVVGLAFDLANEVELSVASSTSFDITGYDADTIPRDDSNYVLEGARRTFELAGEQIPPFTVRIEQRVPVASGLGSSAAALVAGAVAANALLGERVARTDVLRSLATREGHAEQVGAALLGGAVATIPVADDFLVVPLAVHEDLRFALATPATRLETKAARAALPASVPFADAVTQVASAFALVPGLAQADPQLLAAGTRDRMHQDPRASLLPTAPTVLAAARNASALASCWSGAGPTMLGICVGDTTAAVVCDAMRSAFAGHGLECITNVCCVDPLGTTVLAAD